MKRTPLYKNKEWLTTQYLELNQTCLAISRICNCHYRTIHSWLIRFDIPRRQGGWNDMPLEQRALRSQWAKKHHDLLVLSSSNQIHTLESRRKHGESIRGNKHWNWKGGVSNIVNRIRESLDYQLLRLSTFVRDNYTCQICGKRGGQLIMHHIIPVSVNLQLSLQESNTTTVCRICHAIIHRGKSRFEKSSLESL